jgi:intracellular septation protein A
MLLSRRWSAFLIVVAVWNWLVWPRFAKAIWNDSRAFEEGVPTGFFWVHAVLIVSALAIGSAVGVLGVKGWRAARRSASAGSKPA